MLVEGIKVGDDMETGMLPILYRDDSYVVWDDEEHRVISLGIPARLSVNRLILDFSYEELRKFGEIVTDIEVPEDGTLLDEGVMVLYGDGASWMVWAAIDYKSENMVISLCLVDRKSALQFSHKGWKDFVEMIANLTELLC